MNTRLASYSASTLLKRFEVKRISGRVIREAYAANVDFDLEITDYFNKDCGRYVSPRELKAAGEFSVFVRFNQDREACRLILK